MFVKHKTNVKDSILDELYIHKQPRSFKPVNYRGTLTRPESTVEYFHVGRVQ